VTDADYNKSASPREAMKEGKRLATASAVGILILLSAAAFCVLLWRVQGEPPAGERPASFRIKDRESTSRLNTVPILLYHNLNGKGVFSLDSEILRSHFQMLRDRGIRVIGLPDFISHMEKPAPSPGKAVAITFDDGFYTMYTALMPIAASFGYPITLFVYTDIVYARAKKSLTWDRLAEMEKNGISAESHSVSHADLTRILEKGGEDTRRRLFEEIYLSKRIMELYLQKRIRYFAFPYGRYNLPLIRLCQLAGYERVLSTDYGPNILTRNNYCLRRRHIKRDYDFSLIEKIVE
jgi:peptidoglycan/xylan/chitin deacetylase (PgdA/CDA1 family)